MAGVKLTAEEAYERGLITRVYPKAEFHQKLTENAQHIASLPPMVQRTIPLPPKIQVSTKAVPQNFKSL